MKKENTGVRISFNRKVSESSGFKTAQRGHRTYPFPLTSVAVISTVPKENSSSSSDDVIMTSSHSTDGSMTSPASEAWEDGVRMSSSSVTCVISSLASVDEQLPEIGGLEFGGTVKVSHHN